ncbi:TonB-dependent receptor [Parvularcula maris]|uniref:TonB-dependent receptor n=1 Tax=Parvularcula maris TaxID=2965077 RepID=A0A9X2LAR8_9PROT|nr:TonB-dependent receptor [Parvularcula maris]MCQ8186265.1 TonB-dependent receptor [Parvularcula maris]
MPPQNRAFLLSLSLPALMSAMAHAEPGGASDRLDEIVVTGERTDRSLKETASSVAVTTAARQDALAGLDTLEQIIRQTVGVNPANEGNQGPTIRGANTSGVLTSLESFFGGSQPRTTITVDGRQLTFNEFVFSPASTWDLDQVEIFRGPQTTTQGRNAISGAILIETADPNHDVLEGRAQVVVGSLDTLRTSGVISGPIGDGQLAFRLAADYLEEESPVTPLGVEEDIGADLRAIETLNLRGKLGWKPDALEGFEALFTVTHTDTQRPQTDSVDLPFEDRERFNPGFSVFTTGSTGGILETGLTLSDKLSLRNTATVTTIDVERLAPVGTGNADIENDEFSNEFVAEFGGETMLSGLFGVYVWELESDERLDLSAFGIGTGTFTDERSSLGVFGQTTWSPTEALHLTLGGRYQRDAQNREGGFDGIIPVDFDETFDAFLPRAELALDVTPRTRIGLTAERGFNAGGFTFNFDTFATELFEEETLWNYEAFLRSDLAGGTVSIAANLFYTDFEDLQIATLVELGPEFFANVFSNVPEARSIGAEVDVSWSPSDALTLTGGVGLVDTEFTSDSVAGAELDGNEFQRAPGVTAIASAVWRPLPRWTLSAFGRYTDGFFSDDSNLPENEVDSFFVADAQVSYELGRARLFVDATNIFDETFETFVFDRGSTASLGEPRRVTGGIDVRF